MLAQVVILGFIVFASTGINPFTVFSQELVPSDNFNTYSNSQYGVSMKYPSGWEKMDGGLLDALKVNNTVPVVTFNPPDKSVSVLIYFEKLAENHTLETYVNDFLSSIKENNLGLEVIDSSSSNLSGMPAKKLNFQGTADLQKAAEIFGIDELVGDLFNVPPITTQGTQFITLKGGNAYSLVYQDTSGLQNAMAVFLGNISGMSNPEQIQNQFSYYSPVAQSMIDSFEIIKVPISTTDGPSTQPIAPTQESDNVPCTALKTRLVQGEITIPEYQELSKVIGCI